MSPATGLKLAIDPRQVARLAAHPLLKRATRRATRKVYRVYYDTPELDLWRAGVTLRLQRSGRRWMQTVNSGGSVTAGLNPRREFETAVKAQAPDFDALDASAVAAYFSSRELRGRLKPLFVTEFTRASCMLAPVGGVAIEASINRGLVKCGDATAPICEIELEMNKGPAWRAYQTGVQLLDAAQLLVDDRATAQRGIELYLGAPQKPAKTPPSALVTGMASNDAFKALVQTSLAHYTTNQHGMLADGDPEYLHQMRVALRRLRSVFATFAPLFPPAVLAPPVAETRWLARLLGAARDWDVFATETLPPVLARYAEHAGLEALARATARLRVAANRRARRAVISARGQHLLLALGAWTSAETWSEALNAAQLDELQRPAIEFARETLSANLKRVRRRGKQFAHLEPADLHRLRIAAKRLRYATEFFAPLFDDKPARDYRAVLARLQDGLGAYNDAVKITQMAKRASRGMTDAPADEARGIMLGWSAGMQDAGSRYVKRIWKEFRGAEPFWK